MLVACPLIQGPCVCLHRVTVERDTKVMNAATFVLQREDHTLGNLIRM